MLPHGESTMTWLRRNANWFFGGLVAVALFLLLAVVLYPSVERRVLSVASLLLVLATLIYAWLTSSLVQQAAASVEAMREGNAVSREQVEEMRQTRREAAKPEVIADHGRGELRAYFLDLRNRGNGIARNIVVTVRGAPVPRGMTPTEPVVGRRAILTPTETDTMTVEANLTPYASDPHVREYQVVATYQDTLGNSLQSVTVYEKDNQHDDRPIGPVTHDVRYV